MRRAAWLLLKGYNEGGLNDQGIAFFLPNMTWLQPPGYVHGMIGDTWQPNNLALEFTINGGRPSMAWSHAVSAQASSDGRTVVGRVVNTDNSTRTSSNFELQCV